MDKQIDIKALRLSLGKISQEELASLLGVDQSTISNWERDSTTPRGPALKLLNKLAAETRA
jgi:DNA-binding transcriptional regulator YiaG